MMEPLFDLLRIAFMADLLLLHQAEQTFYYFM